MKIKAKNQTGFSLIELIIVVLIIGVIAVIAVPNLLSSRRAANQGAAVSALRTIHNAQMNFASSSSNGNFGTLSALSSAYLIDDLLGCASEPCVKSGYHFYSAKTDATAGAAAKFAVKAEPVTPTGTTRTGNHSFAISTSGVVYFGDPDAGSFDISGGDLSGTSGVLAN